MKGSELDALADLERAYDHGTVDVDFSQLLRAHPVACEEELASLIEADGRRRIALQRGVDLDRYLEADPTLHLKPVALDAAIDVTLRSIEASGEDRDTAVATLEDNYPQFAAAVRTAAMLDLALLSTRSIGRSEASELNLPVEMGSRLADGRARYELRERLGAGGQGRTYLAVDRQLSSHERPAWVVVKLLHHARPGDQNPTSRWTEALRARRVQHPNVVRVLDCGVAGNGADLLVFEHVAGETLTARHARTPFDARGAARLMAGVARGVQAAHAAVIVHRDLKPDNVIVDNEGAGRVADFGAAAVLGDGVEMLNPGEEVVRGNLAFAAPEQIRMDTNADRPASDVYALAAMLLWLVTGSLAQGKTAAAITAQAEGGNEASAPWRRAVAGLDPDLRAILSRSLSDDPDRRHGCAEAFAADLERWLGYEPLTWSPPSVLRRGQLLLRRQPFVGAVTFAAVVVLMLVAGGLGYQSGESERQRLVALSKAADANAAAEVARASAAIERDKITHATVAAEAALRAMGQMNQSKADWYPILAVLESIWGPTIFDPSKGRAWEERIEQTQAVVDVARSRGRGQDPDVLMWEFGLGYWLLRADRVVEAAEVLERNAAGWPRSEPPGQWLMLVDAVRDAARLRRMSLPESGVPAGEVERLRADLAGRLEGVRALPYSRTLIGEVVKAIGPGTPAASVNPSSTGP